MCEECLPTVDHASRSKCPTLLHVHDPVRAELHSAPWTDRSVRHASRCLPWRGCRCRRARSCVHSCHQTARYRTDCPSRPAMFLPALGGLPSFVCQYGARYCPNFIMGRRHRNSRWGSCAHVRCRFRAPTNVSAPIQSDQALQPLPTDGMLRKDVCWIAFAVDFPQVYAFGSHGLLGPKRMCQDGRVHPDLDESICRLPRWNQFIRATAIPAQRLEAMTGIRGLDRPLGLRQQIRLLRSCEKCWFGCSTNASLRACPS